ncbi:signal peptidase II [soil metagenome]|nr:signal peptidase II [Trueperaceae bacterium]
MVRSSALPLALAVALVALDQWTKGWVVATIPLGVREASLGLGFHLTHTRNPGVAFGFLRDLQLIVGPVLVDGTVVLGLLNLVVSGAIVFYLVMRGSKLGTLTRVALALVLAGALGNAVDRIQLGYVIDFIHFQVGAFDFPVFNVADACVVIGAGLLLLTSLRRDAPGERAATERTAPER